jgi:hypothetical protein
MSLLVSNGIMFAFFFLFVFIYFVSFMHGVLSSRTEWALLLFITVIDFHFHTFLCCVKHSPYKHKKCMHCSTFLLKLSNSLFSSTFNASLETETSLFHLCKWRFFLTHTYFYGLKSSSIWLDHLLLTLCDTVICLMNRVIHFSCLILEILVHVMHHFPCLPVGNLVFICFSFHFQRSVNKVVDSGITNRIIKT